MYKDIKENSKTARLTTLHNGYHNTPITLLHQKGSSWIARIIDTNEEIQVWDEDFILDPVSGKRVYYTKCWDCGCDRYIYYPNAIEVDSSDIKVKCEDCGRLFEGERAIEILKVTGVIEADNTSWHGIDVNNEINLSEYGLLVRYVPDEDSWQCIYKSEFGSSIYCHSWIDEADLNEMFTTGWAVNHLVGFCGYIGCTWEEWLQKPTHSRIYDVYNYLGDGNIFGTDYSGGNTLDEIYEEIGIKCCVTN